MPITPDQLRQLSFGYLTGVDLAAWCPAQLLIKANNDDPNALQNGCATAISEVKASLQNLYDVDTEFAKTGTARAVLCVKVTAIHAVANIMGNAQAISEKMIHDIDLARKDLLLMRTGQLQLPLGLPPCETDENGKQLPWPAALPQLVCSSFSNLG